MKCPVCGSGMDDLGSFPFADFDSSLFNCEARLCGCFACDFLRTAFPFSDSEMSDYYENSDSLYTSLSGVGVGGGSPEDLARYAHYLKIISESGAPYSVTDVGCSRGGFLKYLQSRSAIKVHGIEIDREALACLSKNGISGTYGSALALPASSSSLEFLTYFHVLEHVGALDTALSEIARTLVPGGMVLVEVPDAENYGTARIGDWYWLAMKEHVNHFTAVSLCRLLEKFGLGVQKTVHSLLPMKNGASYPSLCVVAQKKRKSPLTAAAAAACRPLGWFKEYHGKEAKQFERTTDRMRKFSGSFERMNYWGIGLEFLNLAAHKAVLSGDDPSVFLFDQNREKRKKTVRGHAISPVEALHKDGGLAITSYLSGDEILRAVLQRGWPQSSVMKI